MIPTSFDASRSHSSGRNFIFLWGGQVHLFSYSRIESESTTTLVTKATNTRLKQQTFQPLNWNKEIVKSLLYNFSPWTETKKSLNLYFITLGAFHSPSGQGVRWFKEGKNPPWKHIHHCHIALNIPCSPRPVVSNFTGERGGVGGAKQDGRCTWAMWKWWIKQKQSPNLHWAKEVMSATQIVFTLEFLYAWICWFGEWGEVGR